MSSSRSSNYINSIQLESVNLTDQKFRFEESHVIGYYYIKDDEGYCLAVKDNNGNKDASVVRSKCHTHISGELWKWLEM